MRSALYFFIWLYFILFELQSQSCNEFVFNDSVSFINGQTFRAISYRTPSEEEHLQLILSVYQNKYYLKIITSKILYFDLISNLEIISDNMQITFKNVKQIKSDNHRGYMVVEVPKNYITTLKNLGITSIVFNGKTEKLSKKNTRQIKQVAECFLNEIINKQ
ncbi:MAG: hypothetical protein N3F09_00830 [Bacteroidia bacterium]|nr:hypothetical protein [Bacteroidia bacterium]